VSFGWAVNNGNAIFPVPKEKKLLSKERCFGFTVLVMTLHCWQ
jgi:hypothetical protein